MYQKQQKTRQNILKAKGQERNTNKTTQKGINKKDDISKFRFEKNEKYTLYELWKTFFFKSA